MKKNKFYESVTNPGIYIFVNYIVRQNEDGVLLNVNWWKKDNNNIKVSMDLNQEHFIPKDQLQNWVLAEDTYNNVYLYWRPM
jgi:hypothetical protein